MYYIEVFTCSNGCPVSDYEVINLLPTTTPSGTNIVSEFGTTATETTCTNALGTSYSCIGFDFTQILTESKATYTFNI
jgi:hypothetical protein